MKRLAVVAALMLVASTAFCQASGYSRNTDRGYVGRGYAVGSGAGSVPEVITKIISTRSTYPNIYTDVDDSFDVVNKADDGTSIRYGFISSLAKDTGPSTDYLLYTNGTNQETYMSVPQRMAFVWFSLDGVNVGDKINEAEFYINTSAYGDNACADGAYFACHIDTAYSDFGILDAGYPATDECLMNITWNNMDAPSGSVLWEPDLDTRGDWFEYGIRAVPLSGANSGTGSGRSFVFDVTDALQKVVDRGSESIGKGLLITITTIKQINILSSFSAGSNVTHVGTGGGVNSGDGNPALTIETSSKRGQMMWVAGKVPVCIMFDDQHPGTVGWLNEMTTHGVNYDMVAMGTAWGSTSAPGTYIDCDSLYTASHSIIDITAHTTNHDLLGDLTGASLNTLIDRASWINSTNFTVMPDTSALAMNFAWTGGATQIYSMEGLWKLAGFGYKSARAESKGWDQYVGHKSYPSWDNHQNTYIMGSALLAGVFTGTFPQTDYDTIKANLMRIVSDAQTNYGRAAVVLYGHRDSPDGISVAGLAVLTQVIEESHVLELVSYDDIVGMSRSKGFVDVDAVVSATNILRAASFADSMQSQIIYTSSVMQDSTATAEGGNPDAMFDLMWVGPATE